MCRMFTGRSRAVMAGTAGAKNLGVIDHDWWDPDRRAMAIFANVCRLNVGLVFAGRLDSVVAIDTITGDINVIKIGRYPGVSDMAAIAGVIADNMCRIFARCAESIVAPNAITDDAIVIEYGGQPACRAMAIIALIAG